MRVVRTMLLLSLLLLVACQAGGPTALTQADKDAIAEVSASFLTAAQNKDWAGVAALYTEDGIMMPPNGHAVQGRAAIQTFFEGFPPHEGLNLVAVEVEGSGDMAYVRGTYTMTITLEGMDPITDSGKFIEVRKKGADGRWLLHRDIFNSDVEMGH